MGQFEKQIFCPFEFYLVWKLSHCDEDNPNSNYMRGSAGVCTEHRNDIELEVEFIRGTSGWFANADTANGLRERLELPL